MVLQLTELNTALLGAFEKLKTLDYRDIIEFLKNEELRNPKNVALASIASVLLSAAAIQILKKVLELKTIRIFYYCKNSEIRIGLAQ